MGVPPSSLHGLFHGKSQSKMENSGVPLFQETYMYIYIYLTGMYSK